MAVWFDEIVFTAETPEAFPTYTTSGLRRTKSIHQDLNTVDTSSQTSFDYDGKVLFRKVQTCIRFRSQDSDIIFDNRSDLIHFITENTIVGDDGMYHFVFLPANAPKNTKCHIMLRSFDALVMFLEKFHCVQEEIDE